MTENKKERVIIFIDGSNFYHIVKNMYKDKKMKRKMFDFDFEKFSNFLTGKRKLIRTYYYIAPLDKNKDKETYSKQQKFFEKLRNIPNFNLILCRMQKGKIGEKEFYTVKEDDINLAVDMVKLAYNDAYDDAILVSSDGDFVPAIKVVKETGKVIENIGFENKFSFHLKNECDNFRKLSKEELNKFFIK
ncbi:MAG: NYN domain-containing protein [Candidatus Pacearchaeota archaeon]|jgi:uncharacterized LabA/DUF88 family protein